MDGVSGPPTIIPNYHISVHSERIAGIYHNCWLHSGLGLRQINIWIFWIWGFVFIEIFGISGLGLLKHLPWPLLRGGEKPRSC